MGRRKDRGRRRWLQKALHSGVMAYPSVRLGNSPLFVSLIHLLFLVKHASVHFVNTFPVVLLKTRHLV